jgi:hypothetical protein
MYRFDRSNKCQRGDIPTRTVIRLFCVMLAAVAAIVVAGIWISRDTRPSAPSVSPRPTPAPASTPAAVHKPERQTPTQAAPIVPVAREETHGPVWVWLWPWRSGASISTACSGRSNSWRRCRFAAATATGPVNASRPEADRTGRRSRPACPGADRSRSRPAGGAKIRNCSFFT